MGLDVLEMITMIDDRATESICIAPGLDEFDSVSFAMLPSRL